MKKIINNSDIKINMLIGSKIKELREAKNLNQDKFAEIINTHKNTIVSYEKGKRKIPCTAVVKLANYFEIPIEYFCEEVLRVDGTGKIYKIIKIDK